MIVFVNVYGGKQELSKDWWIYCTGFVSNLFTVIEVLCTDFALNLMMKLLLVGRVEVVENHLCIAHEPVSLQTFDCIWPSTAD